MKSVSFLATALLCAAGTYAEGTLSYCKTFNGRSKVSTVPTSSLTWTVTRTQRATRTIQPMTTITPRIKTVTSTSWSTETDTTTASSSTDTITASALVTANTTTTVDSTSTSVSLITTTGTTTVTSYVTSTIETSTGFTAVASETGYINKQGYKRDVADDSMHIEARDKSEDEGKTEKDGAKVPRKDYPTKVVCIWAVETQKTTTVATITKKTKTVTATPTSTVIVTGATTTVSTAGQPDTAVTTTPTTTATITQFNVETETATSTTTSYSTSTTTVTANYYAACSDDNLVSKTPNGNFISVIQAANNYTTNTLASKPYDCCASCINDAACGASAFHQGTCWHLAFGSTCDPTAHIAGFSGNDNDNDTFVVSNSNCGQIVWQPSGANGEYSSI